MPRSLCGEQHPRAKLTGAEARAVRESREPTAALMRRYGVSRSTINKIRRGELYPAAAEAEQQAYLAPQALPGPPGTCRRTGCSTARTRSSTPPTHPSSPVGTGS
jgi:hypothetical protein